MVRITAKVFVSIIVSIIGYTLSGYSVSNAADSSPHQSRYVYCNVYVDRACFGIASGDSLDMQLPADYTLYTVVLATGLKALVYVGYNPQDDVFKAPGSKTCATKDASGKCHYIRSVDAFDLLYEADANSPYVHIHLTDLNSSSARDVQDFLGNFRACKLVKQSVMCTDERIFKGIVP